MASVLSGNLPSLVRTAFTSHLFVQLTSQRLIHISNVDFRARKGTRDKQAKKKVKVEVKKIDFYTKLAMAKQKNKSKIVDKPIDDTELPTSCDDVFEIATYKTKVFSLQEAIQNLKELNDPSVNNNPNGFIKAKIELNMVALKKSKTLENFTRIAMIDHPFLETQDRRILVLCNNKDLYDVARKAGASLVGGTELIKSIQKGDLKLAEYRYILAHPDIVVDIIPLRGLLKRRFPSVDAGTINADLSQMITKFMNGIEYRGVKHEFDPKFGLVDASFGRLSMPTDHLVDNFVSLLKDVESNRPKRDGLFVSRCFLESEPTSDFFKIDPFVYIKLEESSKQPEEPEEPETQPAAEVDSDDEANVKVAKKG